MSINFNSMHKEEPLIHKACLYGEMDTMSDLIEVKGVDPCLVNQVGSDIP